MENNLSLNLLKLNLELTTKLYKKLYYIKLPASAYVKIQKTNP